jgi:hypothetical protein
MPGHYRNELTSKMVALKQAPGIKQNGLEHDRRNGVSGATRSLRNDTVR